ESRVTVVVRNPSLAKFADAGPVPAGAFNPIDPAAVQGVSGVKINGDLATVDLEVPSADWGVRGQTATLQVLQELVYTATEEPGIHRALITQNGGKTAKIDQHVVDKPLAREDVFGYSRTGPLGASTGISLGGD